MRKITLMALMALSCVLSTHGSQQSELVDKRTNYPELERFANGNMLSEVLAKKATPAERKSTLDKFLRLAAGDYAKKKETEGLDAAVQRYSKILNNIDTLTTALSKAKHITDTDFQLLQEMIKQQILSLPKTKAEPTQGSQQIEYIDNKDKYLELLMFSAVSGSKSLDDRYLSYVLQKNSSPEKKATNLNELLKLAANYYEREKKLELYIFQLNELEDLKELLHNSKLITDSDYAAFNTALGKNKKELIAELSKTTKNKLLNPADYPNLALLGKTTIQDKYVSIPFLEGLEERIGLLTEAAEAILRKYRNKAINAEQLKQLIQETLEAFSMLEQTIKDSDKKKWVMVVLKEKFESIEGINVGAILDKIDKKESKKEGEKAPTPVQVRSIEAKVKEEPKRQGFEAIFQKELSALFNKLNFEERLELMFFFEKLTHVDESVIEGIIQYYTYDLQKEIIPNLLKLIKETWKTEDLEDGISDQDKKTLYNIAHKLFKETINNK